MVSVRGRVCQDGAEGWREPSRLRSRVTVAPLGPNSLRRAACGLDGQPGPWRPVPSLRAAASPCSCSDHGEGRQGTVVTWCPCVGSCAGGAVVCGVPSPSFLERGTRFLLSVSDVWEAESQIQDPFPSA